MKDTLRKKYGLTWVKILVYIIITIIFFNLGKKAIDVLFPILGFENI
ncbi:hypothetical protein [Enterococcus plantarum]|nr:hypothetical protein [Enterococcus plantarum]MBO0424286.1 hypothetical protein [Enterococcus plantarum]